MSVRTLVVVAHPDDVDYCAAGTVCQWTDTGVDVVYCVLTDGDAGAVDSSVAPVDLARIRRDEQRAAAKVAGVRDVRFLGYPDGRLEASMPLRRDISRVIRQVRPHRMVIQSPEINWARLPDAHPDHRVAGEAALRAIYPDARNSFAHPELLRDEELHAWSVSETWVMTSPRPNRFVDVTRVFGRKIAALEEHRSQIDDLGSTRRMLRSWMSEHAQQGGLAKGRLAEAFQVVHTA